MIVNRAAIEVQSNFEIPFHNRPGLANYLPLPLLHVRNIIARHSLALSCWQFRCHRSQRGGNTTCCDGKKRRRRMERNPRQVRLRLCRERERNVRIRWCENEFARDRSIDVYRVIYSSSRLQPRLLSRSMTLPLVITQQDQNQLVTRSNRCDWSKKSTFAGNNFVIVVINLRKLISFCGVIFLKVILYLGLFPRSFCGRTPWNVNTVCGLFKFVVPFERTEIF